jgi:hypothetical protein
LFKQICIKNFKTFFILSNRIIYCCSYIVRFNFVKNRWVYYVIILLCNVTIIYFLFLEKDACGNAVIMVNVKKIMQFQTEYTYLKIFIFFSNFKNKISRFLFWLKKQELNTNKSIWVLKSTKNTLIQKVHWLWNKFLTPLYSAIGNLWASANINVAKSIFFFKLFI